MNTVPSPAAQLMITIIPITGIVVAGMIVFFFLLWNHRQRMEQIRRGLPPAPRMSIRAVSLLVGLVTASVGAALTTVQLALGHAGYNLLGGVIPLAVGIGLLLFSRFSRHAAE
ncbi:MAG: hypothetical protein PF508_03260 [Spirochaeta sp.]|nr:hypothetical protein [Spirochaeta sp.]